MKINQFLVALSYGDAISNEALEIQKILVDMGYDSHIYAQYVDSRLAKHFCSYEKYEGDSDNICIFHFSIGAELVDFVKALPDRKIMIYHNLTPADFFEGYNDHLYSQLLAGRKKLASFSDDIKLSLGDSEYNARELRELGFDPVGVQPIIMPPYENKKFFANKPLGKKLQDGKKNILFVGRIAPNKKQEDVIRTFALYQKIYNPQSRLILVGNYTGMESYYGRLVAMVDELGLHNVLFTGLVPEQDLHTYYRMSDVFLCMSEHEGFLVPVLECAQYGLPIVAYDSGAIGETVNGGAVLLAEKNIELAAAWIDRIVADDQVKQEIVDSQSGIIDKFSYEKTRAIFEKYLEQLIDEK